jgi:hypothetical protein
MKFQAKQEFTLTLVLTKDEALWLRNVTQNPIGSTLEDEAEYDKEMRQKFFTATSGTPECNAINVLPAALR